MTRFLRAFGLLAVCGSTAANAADLPSQSPAPPPPVPLAYSWTGFYFGANAGYAFDTRVDFNTFNGPGGATGVPIFRPAFAQLDENGFIGGGQIGYNYELGDLLHLGPAGSGVVIGVEADAAYTDLASAENVISGPFGGRFNYLHSRLDFLGTARGRLGYAFDRAFIYGTGGFAYGETNDFSNFETARVSAYAGGRSGLSTGYAVGGGVEYAVPADSFVKVFSSGTVTLKGEFLHYELDPSSYPVGRTGLVPAVLPGSFYTQTVRIGGNLVRAGLNFKFGAPAPVVARY